MSGFEDKMVQLRARFVIRAGEERAQLAAALEIMDRAEMRRLSHGLSGSAGIFGFPAIGLDAQAVEEAVDEGADDEAVRGLCTVLIERLGGVGQED